MRDDELACGFAGLDVGDAGQLHRRVDASEPDGEENPSIGVGAICRNSSASSSVGSLVNGSKTSSRRRACRTWARDRVGHLGATVTDRVVPQAWPSIDERRARSRPAPGSFAAFDADEARSGGLGIGMKERCGHVTTVPNGSIVKSSARYTSTAEEVWVLPTATATTQPRTASTCRAASRTSTAPPPRTARLSVLRAIFVVLAVIFAIAGAFGIDQRSNAINDVRTASRQLLALQDIQVRIVHADAIASSSYLRSGQEDPAQRTAYLDEIATAGDGLVAVSGAATDADLGQLSEASRLLGSYVGLVEQARANNRQGFPVGATYQRQANGIVSNTDPDVPDIVSSLRAVEASQRDQINDSLATAHRAGLWLHLFGWLLLIALILGSLWLSRTFRRVINIPIALAAVALLLLLVIGGTAQAGAVSDTDDAVGTRLAGADSAARAGRCVRGTSQEAR